MRTWTPLTERGDALAQFDFGVRYYYGNGVLKDFEYPHMSGSIFASKGYEDAVAKLMTPADIPNALRLVREYVQKNYKNC